MTKVKEGPLPRTFVVEEPLLHTFVCRGCGYVETFEIGPDTGVPANIGDDHVCGVD